MMRDWDVPDFLSAIILSTEERVRIGCGVRPLHTIARSGCVIPTTPILHETACLLYPENHALENFRLLLRQHSSSQALQSCSSPSTRGETGG
jgi:hypothetical protein